MMKITILATAFIVLAGCASGYNQSRMEARLDQLERENNAFRRHFQQEQAKAKKQDPGTAQNGQKQDASAPPQQPDPSVDPNQPIVTVANVSTFAQANPGAFQCFMDRDPGFGGEWVEVMNYTRKYWVSVRIDSQPVIVLRPVPGGWQPYYARSDVTVLPPGKVCYAWMPQGRMKPDGDLQDYDIEADAYFPSYKDGWRVLLPDARSSYFPHEDDPATVSISQFTLAPGGTTYRVLRDYMFK